MKTVQSKTEPPVYQKYTKYEVARIIGARALQISMNAPLLLKEISCISFGISTS